MLGVTLYPQLKKAITDSSPFSWAPNSSMNYLGIQLTSPSTLLLRTNITLLGRKVQDIAKSLLTVSTDVSTTTWYLFRTLPIPSLYSDVATLQRTINQFVWAACKPCIKSSLIYTPRTYAGLGVPDLRTYYKAIIFDQTKKLWDMASLQPWTLIEAAAFAQNPPLMLAAVWMGHHPSCSFLPTINATISIWKSTLQTWEGLHAQAFYQLPLSTLSLLSPDLPLQNWTMRGIQRIGDLFQLFRLLSFLQLKDRFNILNKEFYVYPRLCHIILTIPASNSTLIRHILHFYTQTDNKVHGISYLYSLLLKPKQEKQSPIIAQWESTLQIWISPPSGSERYVLLPSTPGTFPTGKH